MNVNELMNMNDMYYVGNIVDVDGDGWVSKAEAQAILDEICDGEGENKVINWNGVYDYGYGDESPAEHKRMLAEVGVKIK